MEVTKNIPLSPARLALDQGNFTLAERLYREILAVDPSNALVKLHLGELYVKTARYSQATPLLQSATSTESTSSAAHHWLGVTARSTGDLPIAVENGKVATRKDPANAEAHFSLALSYLAEKDAVSAIASLQTAIAIQDDVSILHHFLGDAFRLAGRDDEAITAYRRAFDLAPNVPNSALALAVLLRRRGSATEAATAILAALDATPSDSGSQIRLARAFAGAGLLQDGLEVLIRVIEMDSDHAEARATLGNIYQQLGQFDAAREQFERAIVLKPNTAKQYLDLVSCKKTVPNDLPLIDQMARMLQGRSHSLENRCYLHYAIAKAYDDLREFSKAMRHYDEANGIMRGQLAGKTLDRDLYRFNTDEAIKTFTPQYLRRNRSLANASDLPILIVGMIRSGTSLVEQIVSSHPNVGAGGEQDFLLKRWGRILQPKEGSPHADEAARVIIGYLNLLKSLAPGKTHVTDKMPHNFRLLGLAHLLFPNARFIHVRRNPLDTCISIYTTFFQEPINIGHDPDTIVFVYNEYLRLVDHWRRVLPSDRFIEIDYEDLITDQEAVTRRLISFCGLQWDDACLRHEQNDAAIRTPSAWQARQPVYSSSVGRWRNYPDWIELFSGLTA